MNVPAALPKPPRRLFLAIVAVLVGGFLVFVGTAGALLPLLTRDATACIYNITPPAEFVNKYHEGITSGEAAVSAFPFGAQCTYVATSTGEIAFSIIPLWPTFAVLSGLATLLAGVGGLVLAYTHKIG
ncbi:hypothetical protein ACWPKO_23670 (plasmid) [Coraliomargarita sp. W4R53]